MESNTRIINGCEVIFPAGKTPFPAQLAIMSKVLCALNKEEHALISASAWGARLRRRLPVDSWSSSPTAPSSISGDHLLSLPL